MPTKRNHAGNQQPYIPAGNGDPSGEYGDNATGGNVHIRIERKDPIEQVEPKGSETAKPKETEQAKKTSGQAYVGIADYLNRHSNFTSPAKTRIAEIMKGVDDRYNSILNNALNSNNYDIKMTYGKASYYSAGWRKLQCSSNDFTDNAERAYVKGGVFYHENGHLIDYSKATDRFNPRPLSTTFISEKYQMSLGDMVREEAKSINWEAVRADFDKEPSAQKYREAKATLNDAEKKYRKNAFGADGDKLWDAYVKTYNEFEKVGAPLKRKWGDISDMMDAANDGMEERLCGMGHGESYWRQNWDNKGTEFFAETFQAETVNHESLELIKKYYPKSYDIFSEILRSLEK